MGFLMAPVLCVFFQSSVLGSGFGELGGPKLGQTAGQQILEQLKGPGLGQLTSQPSSTGTNCTPVGGLVGTGMSVPSSSSWDIKPPGTLSSSSLPSQFSRECYNCFTEPETNLFSLANTWLCINTVDLFTRKSDVSTQKDLQASFKTIESINSNDLLHTASIFLLM